MSRRRTNQHDYINYSKISSVDNGFTDEQFAELPPKVPWKALILAALLFSGGSCLLTLGSLIITGHLDVTFADRLWPMMILGALMFIPGAYHIRLAYCAYKQIPGYSFNDIPEFD